MAKESVKARQRKRVKMVAQFAEKRAALKAAGDQAGLDLLPKNASPVRLKNRCQLTGRPRGYIRYFGLSRNQFRDMALAGKIPGVTKQAGNLIDSCRLAVVRKILKLLLNTYSNYPRFWGRRRTIIMVTDPIADFLTRIRNAQMANHRIVEIPASNLKKRITEILYEKGYILKYKFEDDNKQGVIKIALKYDAATKVPAIRSLERVSRPGLRQYSKPADFTRVKNGLGIAIISTSQGVMTDKEAKAQNVGGEVLCYVY